MRFVKAAGHRFGIATELFSFFWGHKRWWMLPMLVTLFLFGALLILAQSSAIAPFIYAVLVLPFGLAIRLFSDPLKIKNRPAEWIDHAQDVIDLEWAHRQG